MNGCLPQQEVSSAAVWAQQNNLSRKTYKRCSSRLVDALTCSQTTSFFGWWYCIAAAREGANPRLGLQAIKVTVVIVELRGQALDDTFLDYKLISQTKGVQPKLEFLGF